MPGGNGTGRGLESLALAGLVSQVCHDLNNHLATLLGKTEVALMVGDPARYRPALEHGLEAGQPARGLVSELQRLMTWLREGESGVPVSDAVTSAVRLCERSCSKRGLQLRVKNRFPGARLEDPGRVALICWSLLNRLIQEQPCSSEHVSETWTVETGASGERLEIGVSGPTVGAADPAASDGLRELGELLGLLGGELSAEPGRVELRLESGDRRPLARAVQG